MTKKITSEIKKAAENFIEVLIWVMVEKENGNRELGYRSVPHGKIVAKVEDSGGIEFSNQTISKIRRQQEAEVGKDFDNPLGARTIDKHRKKIEKAYKIKFNPETSKISELQHDDTTENNTTDASYYLYYYIDETQNPNVATLKTEKNLATLTLNQEGETTIFEDGDITWNNHQFSIYFKKKIQGGRLTLTTSYCTFGKEENNRRSGIFATSEAGMSAGKVVIEKVLKNNLNEKINVEIPPAVLLEIYQSRLEFNPKNYQHVWSGNEITYDGYRYFYGKNEIRRFIVKIDFSQGAYLEETGFFGEKISSNGYAQYGKNALFAHLSNKAVKHFSLNIYVGGIAIEDGTNPPNPILSGMYHGGNNENEDRIAGEILLVKQGTPNKLIPIEKIHQYLFSQRKSLRVRGNSYQSWQHLTFAKNSLKDIQHLIGTYRVWSFNRDREIIQSKFRIKDDYNMFLYSLIAKDKSMKDDGGQQVCTFVISKFNESKRLCVNSYSKVGTKLSNFAIIEIPSKGDKNIYLNASFCTVGMESDVGGFPTSAIFMKETKGNIWMNIGNLSEDYPEKLNELLTKQKYKDLKTKLEERVAYNTVKPESSDDEPT